MTVLILQATPFVQAVAPALRTAYRRLLHALDVFAEARMRNAVPEWHQRKAPGDLTHQKNDDDFPNRTLTSSLSDIKGELSWRS